MIVRADDAFDQPEESGDAVRWEADWPSIEFVAIFWFFGLRRKRLLPGAGDMSRPQLEGWARRLNLVDHAGNVPEWVYVAAMDPGKLGTGHSNSENRRVFSLIDTMRAPERFLFQEDLARPSREDIVSRGLWQRVLEELHWHVGNEARSIAQARIEAAFSRWLTHQLRWCEELVENEKNQTGEKPMPLFDQERLDLFVEFQCMGVRVSQLAKGHPGEASQQRKLRNQFGSLARALGLKLREDKRGRERKSESRRK